MEPNSLSRVFHIDALRGVAILMMLQGHFIDTLLITEDRVGLVHAIWKFNRGLTAPVFFTTSGVIIVYLLIRKADIDYRKMRMKKAFWRALEVLMWGYILRFSIWPFILQGSLTNEFFRVDVLNCIGVGLLLLSLLYYVFSKINTNAFRLILLLIALGAFALHPWYIAQDYTSWPPAFRNYFTLAYGSVFTLFPFLGFMFAGGFIGSLYNVFYERNKLTFVLSLLCLGTFLIMYSSPALHALYLKTDIQLFIDITRDNWFIKMGFVLCIYGVFVAAEPLMARLKTLNQIGQYTLTIYVIHFFLLYGSVFGAGIDDILFEKRSLPAEAAIPGALLFVVFVTWLSLKYHKWKDAHF